MVVWWTSGETLPETVSTHLIREAQEHTQKVISKEWPRTGEERHACEHLSKRVMLGASFFIRRYWHCTMAREQSVLCVGGVWKGPSNIPDGVGGWDAHNCPSNETQRPRAQYTGMGRCGLGSDQKSRVLIWTQLEIKLISAGTGMSVVASSRSRCVEWTTEARAVLRSLI